MPPSVLGPYRIVRELGAGGMGTVFEAIYETIERRVAIKILHPEFAKNADVTARFFNEARAVNRIEHPGLVQISDYARLPDGTAYIVMEFLKGESLASHIKRMRGKMSVAHTLVLGWQVADALAAAHAKGIVHRDLKPDNVMLVADTVAPSGVRAKLLDFGIAKLAEAAQAGQVKTRTDAIMGTPRYMSPEQCRGAHEVDDKADVYSLGIMLYVMLAGCPPFEGEGVGEVLAKHIYEPAPALRDVAPEVPHDVASYVQGLLAKDKNQRPPMKAVFEELGNLAAIHSAPASGGGLRPSGLLLPLVANSPGSASQQPTSDVPKDLAFGPTLGADTPGSAAQERVSDPRRSSKSSPVPTNLVSGPNDSTLGSSSGQDVRLPSRRRTLPLVAVLSISILTGSFFLGYRLLDRPQRTPVAPPPPAMPLAKPATVTWSINSDPAGAEIISSSGDLVLGKTPWQTSQPAQPGREEVKLRLPGYAERTITLDRATSSVVNERMEVTPATTASSPVSKPGRARIKPAIRKNVPTRSVPAEIKPPETKGQHGTVQPED